jgi:hypothetical protein
MTVRGWLTVLIMAATLVLTILFPIQIAEIMLSGAVMMGLDPHDKHGSGVSRH